MFVESEALSAVKSLKHGFFTREGGVSSADYATLNCGLGSDDEAVNITANRARVAGQLDVAPEALVTAYQVHSPLAVHVQTPFAPEERPKVDALVTDRPGIAVGVLTADCTPVLFAEPEAGIVGAAHAGWRGALGGVLEATAGLMEKLGANPSRIIAAIGPTISWAAYQVGPEFLDAFMEQDEESDGFFRDDSVTGKFQFDLPGYVEHRLVRMGLREVTNCNLCTYSEEVRFFSYRRATHRGEPDYGRQISAIVINGKAGA